VSDIFDPYHKWLGIPPKDQPPHHYRLLGIEPWESDLDVIEHAADQRMAHLRMFQIGRNAEASQRILNEVAAAKTCLLNPRTKATYDAQLRAALRAAQEPSPAAPAFPPLTDVGPGAAQARLPRGAPVRKRGHSQVTPEMRKIVLGGLAGLVIGYVLLGFLRPELDTFGIARAFRGEDSARKPALSKEELPGRDQDAASAPLAPVAAPPVTPPPSTPALQEVTVVPWAVRQRPQRVIGDNAGFAVLVHVGGHFLGNGENFRLQLDERGDWVLQGHGVRPISASAAGIASPHRGEFEPETTEVTWSKGQKPIQLIHKNDGFAVLAGAVGCFLDSGHEVRVRLDDDGHWYLEGRTNIQTSGVARVYRYRRPGQFRAEVKEYEWRTGSPPQRMIHKDMGLCFLSSMGGGFHGGGETVSLQVDEEGYWRFEGHSLQSTTHCRAISLKYPSSSQ
jgi:hypothetical protein